MIRQVKHVNIPVKDQGGVLAFYAEKLDFEVAFGSGRRWIGLQIPGASTEPTLFTPDGLEDQIGPSTGIVFSADGIEATSNEMVSQGLESAQPLKQESWGTSAIFRDNEGNEHVRLVVVLSPPDQAVSPIATPFRRPARCGLNSALSIR